MHFFIIIIITISIMVINALFASNVTVDRFENVSCDNLNALSIVSSENGGPKFNGNVRSESTNGPKPTPSSNEPKSSSISTNWPKPTPSSNGPKSSSISTNGPKPIPSSTNGNAYPTSGALDVISPDQNVQRIIEKAKVLYDKIPTPDTNHRFSTVVDNGATERSSSIKMRQLAVTKHAVIFQGPDRAAAATSGMVDFLDWVIWDFYRLMWKRGMHKSNDKFRIYIAGTGQQKPGDPAYAGYGGGNAVVSVYYPDLSSLDFLQLLVHELGHCFRMGAKDPDPGVFSGPSMGESFSNVAAAIATHIRNLDSGASLDTFSQVFRNSKFAIDSGLAFAYRILESNRISPDYEGFIDGVNVKRIGYGRYDAWHLWWYLYRKFGLKFLVLLQQSFDTQSVILSDYQGNKIPLTGTPITTTVPNVRIMPGCMLDLEKLIAPHMTLQDFMAMYVADTVSANYLRGTWNTSWCNNATSGDLEWFGYVVVDVKRFVPSAQSFTLSWTIEHHIEDWRIVYVNYSGTTVTTSIHSGQAQNITKPTGTRTFVALVTGKRHYDVLKPTFRFNIN